MSRASSARRIAVVAAFGGTGVGAVWASVWGLLKHEVRLARARIGPPELPLDTDGLLGQEHAGPPLRLVMLGDSTGAGLGVQEAWQTPAVRIATGLAARAHRPVRVRVLAVVGAESFALDGQVSAALPDAPDVAVIMIGSNDVTHRVAPAVSVRLLEQAVRRLRAAGCQVVVGTCPDLGTIEPLAQPLRWLARRASRELAAAQTIAVVEAGGRTVSLGDLLGPEFAANPREMFSKDRFHPSATGYRHAAGALLPSVLAALDLTSRNDRPEAGRGKVQAVADAAVAAADRAGSEVSGAQVGGRDRGPGGRWALLRRRNEALEPPPELSEPRAQEPQGR